MRVPVSKSSSSSSLSPDDESLIMRISSIVPAILSYIYTIGINVSSIYNSSSSHNRCFVRMLCRVWCVVLC